MDTENPDGPEASIESRIAEYFAREAEASPAADDAPPAAEEVTTDAPDPDAEDAEEQPEAAAEEDFAEIEADDGTKHKVPTALKDGYLRHADYTRKTQQAATLAQMAQDRLQYAEAREQFTASVVDQIADLKALEGQLKQFDGLDLGGMYASDPGTALRLRDQREDLRRKIDEAKQHIGAKARQLDEMTGMHSERQWKIAVDGAKQRIGTFTPGEDAAMLKQMEALGFTEKELKGRYADPRILHAIYKAAKWDTLQANKGKAVATAQAAPPVVKPGVSKGAAAQTDQKYRQARERLKSSGSVDDMARLLLLRGLK